MYSSVVPVPIESPRAVHGTWESQFSAVCIIKCARINFRRIRDGGRRTKGCPLRQRRRFVTNPRGRIETTERASATSSARRVGFLATQDELLGQARTSLNLIILSRMTCCLPDSAIKYSMAQCVILNLVLYVRRNLARETERERAEGGGG